MLVWQHWSNTQPPPSSSIYLTLIIITTKSYNSPQARHNNKKQDKLQNQSHKPNKYDTFAVPQNAPPDPVFCIYKYIKYIILFSAGSQWLLQFQIVFTITFWASCESAAYRLQLHNPYETNCRQFFQSKANTIKSITIKWHPKTNMNMMDVSQSSAVWMAALNEDSTSSLTKSSTIVRKSLGAVGAGSVPKVFEDHRDRQSFYKDLYSYHDNKG